MRDERVDSHSPMLQASEHTNRYQHSFINPLANTHSHTHTYPLVPVIQVVKKRPKIAEMTHPMMYIVKATGIK